MMRPYRHICIMPGLICLSKFRERHIFYVFCSENKLFSHYSESGIFIEVKKYVSSWRTPLVGGSRGSPNQG